MSDLDTDVLIIGSGFGAAPPAVRLAEAGFRVVVLEKGPDIDAPSTFEQTQDPDYFLRYYHHLAGERLGMTYIEGLGGGSGFYEMISLRAPSLAFQQRDEGRSVWPDSVNRAVLDPYYEVAERMLNVHQIPVEGVPRSGLVFSRMMKNLGYSCDRAAYAVRGCLGSGFCVSGCIYGAKQSLHFNYIPRARAAGAEYRTGTTAIRIRSIGPSAPVSDLRSEAPRYEVVCRDGSGRRHVHRARIVVVAGGTVGSARLLMASRAELPGLSEAIGRRVAFNGGVKTAGLLGPGWPDGDMFTGRSHPGMISYEFLESHGVTVQAAKPLPLQAIAAARLRIPDPSSPGRRFWGEDHMALMKAYRRRVIVLFALGLTPPTARFELRRGELELRLDVTDELRAYYRRTKALLTSIYEDNGCRALDVDFVDSNGMPRPDVSFSTAHQLGSCPMSDLPAHGVVDATGEAHRLPGLFVTGGAALPGSIAVSTSLTILANAERVSERLVDRLTRRPRVVLAEGV
jgi:cholesterol oxidase